MHIVFIPYGKRSEVELLLCDMDAQKHQLPMTKGKKKQAMWIQGQVRLLPMGLYEYVCPVADGDTVLNTLDYRNTKYNLGILKLALLKKIAQYEKIPEYSKAHKYLWIKQNVNVLILGVRYDKMDFVAENREYKGWTHEAI